MEILEYNMRYSIAFGTIWGSFSCGSIGRASGTLFTCWNLPQATKNKGESGGERGCRWHRILSNQITTLLKPFKKNEPSSLEDYRCSPLAVLWLEVCVTTIVQCFPQLCPQTGYHFRVSLSSVQRGIVISACNVANDASRHSGNFLCIW